MILEQTLTEYKLALNELATNERSLVPAVVVKMKQDLGQKESALHARLAEE